jgi:hypothetical protein
LPKSHNLLWITCSNKVLDDATAVMANILITENLDRLVFMTFFAILSMKIFEEDSSAEKKSNVKVVSLS